MTENAFGIRRRLPFFIISQFFWHFYAKFAKSQEITRHVSAPEAAPE